MELVCQDVWEVSTVPDSKATLKNSKSKSNIAYSYAGYNRQSMKQEVGWKWPPFYESTNLASGKLWHKARWVYTLCKYMQ